MMLLDSDTDNSIIIERDKNRKLACLKDTPAKIKDLRKTVLSIQNMSIQSNSSIQSSDEEQDSDECQESDDNGENDHHSQNLKNDEKIQTDEDDKNDERVQSNDKSHSAQNDTETDNDENSNRVSTGDEGPDEDQMFMSRATRMSIMGVIPKENESDDSDYIQDDDDVSICKEILPNKLLCSFQDKFLIFSRHLAAIMVSVTMSKFRESRL